MRIPHKLPYLFVTVIMGMPSLVLVFIMRMSLFFPVMILAVRVVGGTLREIIMKKWMHVLGEKQSINQATTKRSKKQACK